MLDNCKLALRVSNSAYDTEIEGLIEACKTDLKLSGVASSYIKDTNSLIAHAIILYCKGHFGYDNPDRDKYIASYELLKAHLATSYSEDD